MDEQDDPRYPATGRSLAGVLVVGLGLGVLIGVALSGRIAWAVALGLLGCLVGAALVGTATVKQRVVRSAPAGTDADAVPTREAATPTPSPAADPEPAPDREPSVDPEPAEEHEPEPDMEREPSREAEPHPEPDPAPAPEPDPEPDPAPAADAEPEPDPEPDPAPAQEPDPEPDPAPAAEPDPAQTPAAEAEPAPTPAAEAEPAPTPEAEPHPEPDPAAEPDAAPDPVAEPELPRSEDREPDAFPPAPTDLPEALGPDPLDGTPPPGPPAEPLPLRIPPTPVGEMSWTSLRAGEPGAADATATDAAPYVPRTIDAVLDRALAPDARARTGGVVVAGGPPGSGASRTLWEAVRRAAAERVALVVPTPDAWAERTRTEPDTALANDPLEALLDRLGDVERDLDGALAVVWIDDAHEHLDAGLRLATLDRLVTALPDCIVALVVDPARLDTGGPLPDPTPQWLARVARDHTVPTALSAQERHDVAQTYPHLPPPDRAQLPAVLGGHAARRDWLRDHLDAPDATSARSPSAVRTVLQAVGIWRGVGLPRSIPTGALGALVHALDGTHPAPDVLAGASLLRTEPAGDPLLADGEDRLLVRWDPPAPTGPWSTAVWDALLAHLPPLRQDRTALRLGRLALRDRAPEQALDAWSLAARSTDPQVAGPAAIQLGLLHEQRDDHAAAAVAYQRVAGGDGLDAPLAAFHLGGVLETLERPDEAAGHYRRAMDSGHPDAAPMAAFNLGWLLEQRHRGDEAAATYQLAADSGHPEAAPMAAFNLGWLWERRRRPREAERWYRRSIDSGHRDAAPMAMVSLGLLLQRSGRPGDALSLLRRAAASDHEEAASAARSRLEGPSRG
ncbi:MAG: tetratricopeptide repeat protein [Nitriliruptoraceae bacterium]|nr:tetratricopeptide repeat protein [Nitriliruptoraceae bacterium]